MKKSLLTLIIILLILGCIFFNVTRFYNQELILYAPKDESIGAVEQYYKDVYGEEFTEIVGMCRFDDEFYYGVNINNEPQIVKFKKTSDGNMEECMMVSNGDKTYTLFSEKICGESIIFVANFGSVEKIVFYNDKNNSIEFSLPSSSKGVYFLKNNTINSSFKYDVYDLDGKILSSEETIHFIDE